MHTDPAEARRLLDRLAELHERCNPDEAWRVVRRPHDYPDGTTHFTHVRRTGRLRTGDAVVVAIADYATPELAEFLVLMRNNLPDLLRWARAGLDAAPEGGDG